MKLFKNDPARNFETTDIYGNPIKLSDYKGNKIILGFFRHISCPFCNMHVHNLLFVRDELEEKGVQVICVFESKAEKMLSSSFHQGVSPIPLISDPTKERYYQYDIEFSKTKMLKTMLTADAYRVMRQSKVLDLPTDGAKDATKDLIPADFFINEDFTIHTAHYGKHANDHLSIDDVLAFANK